MAKKKEVQNELEWSAYGRKVILKAVKRPEDGIIKTSSKETFYDYYVHDKGALVPEDIKIGDKVYIQLPGIERIESVTDFNKDSTYVFMDYNYILLVAKTKLKTV